MCVLYIMFCANRLLKGYLKIKVVKLLIVGNEYF